MSLKEEEKALYEHYSFSVDKGQSPLRVDKFLMNFMQNTSRNKIQNACLAGNIWANKQPIKSNYRVKPLDLIQVLMATPPRAYEIIAENIPLDIIYEDECVILVNKPPGLVVHPGCGNYSGTLVHGLKYHFEKNQRSNFGTSMRPGLAHRIDKDTSGLLILAKDEYALEYLARQFYLRSIQRKYLALVWGNLLEDEGKIEAHIGRSTKDRKKMQVFEDGQRGKHAITGYKVLERFGFLTLIECKLETGRTHQIRVHLKHIGHPIFGDHQYFFPQNQKPKGPYGAFIENCLKILPRQALHAFSLGFIHPGTKKSLYFEVPMYEDIATVLQKC